MDKVYWQPGVETNRKRKFSIIIPTWNNLAYLKICIDSIKKNSFFEHQVIVHVNDGSDGTLDYVKNLGLDFTQSNTNVGVCWAVNSCRALVNTDYIVYMNDDMYVLPNWDKELWKGIEELPDKYFFLSSTLIEPVPTAHKGIVAPYNYGQNPKSFDENKLLNEYKSLPAYDWNGATWPPNVIHRDIWDLIGGYSIEFSPGMYSDPDFSIKLIRGGVKYFKGIKKSLVYHFGSKTTQRIKRNDGSKQFLNKWGITSSVLTKHILKRGTPFSGEVDVKDTKLFWVKLKSKLKRVYLSFGGVGLIDEL